MFNIRTYKKADYKMLQNWWNFNNKFCPPEIMLSETTTFIIEDDKQALASITLYLTNNEGLSILEHFIGNPESSKELRKQATKALVDFCYSFAKELNYKYILGFSTNEKLNKYYQELGLREHSKNITSMIRGL